MTDDRLPVQKTHKLYVNGSFVRSESGRVAPVRDDAGRIIAQICHASRKDLRDAVEAATRARAGWRKRSAYNRGQILYRLAEMLESRRAMAIEALRPLDDDAAAAEVDATVDRLVHFAGWPDKLMQVFGHQNPVAGPYYCLSTPEPVGVVAALAPTRPGLLGLVTLLAPALASGNVVVAVGSWSDPLATSLLGEVCATSDVPPGVVNLLLAPPGELESHLAAHRAIDAVIAANPSEEHATTLRGGAAENLKRVHVWTADADEWADASRWETPWTMEPLLEIKTIWHPVAT